MQKFRVPANALCEDCGITAQDTNKPSAMWISRHKRLGIRACEYATKCRSLYNNSSEKRGFKSKMPKDALCEGCGITKDDTHGSKWKGRHYYHKTPICKWSREAHANATRVPGHQPALRDESGMVVRSEPHNLPRKDVGGEHDTLTLEQYRKIRG